MLRFAILALSAMAPNIALPADASALARHHSPTAVSTPASSQADAAHRDPAPPGVPLDQRIVLHRNAGSDKAVLVSVGIPFAPGVLRDIRMLRILDAHGAEVPAAVQTTLKWHFKDGSVRAVRVQFHANLDTTESTFYFALGKPRTLDLAGWPYAQGLVAGEQGIAVPTVVATLTPEWLCQSLIAGPQQPAAPDEPYANYVSTQFKWARELPVKDSTAWLFDRPTTLYKAYIRTGRFDYLQAAILSYHFYMKYIRRDGLPMSPSCAGGWTYGGKPCDAKYVYIEPILLALALTGDDSAHDAQVVDNMATLWAHGGWSGEPGPYTSASQYFTERLTGLGLLETVSAYELTGEARDLARIKERLDWLYAHQQNNPDGLGNDGSWRNSWNLHENDSWHPENDVRGTSPWMTENIIDGLWHAWLVTGDKRIPQMITGFGRYLERYGWISPSLLVTPHDWRDPCSGPDGLIAWYWSSAHTTTKALEAIQDSEGWYSDTHDVELALPIATAYYFEHDPKQSAALKRRFDELAPSYATACAASSKTLRRFNWNNRGSGVAQWLMRQPAGSGDPRPSPEHATQ
ncbi:MAG: hypothetical protein ACREPQ_02415 [Rhodanobacter sp.]